MESIEFELIGKKVCVRLRKGAVFSGKLVEVVPDEKRIFFFVLLEDEESGRRLNFVSSEVESVSEVAM